MSTMSIVARALTQSHWSAIRDRLPELARHYMPAKVPGDRIRARRALHRALWNRRRLPPFVVLAPPISTESAAYPRPTFKWSANIEARKTYRFLDTKDRNDLVWFFRYSGGDIAHTISPAGVAVDRAPAKDISETEMAVRLSLGHATVEASEPVDMAGEPDTDADDRRVFATRRARRVRATLEHLLTMPGGADYAYTLFDAYVSPGVVRGSGNADGIPSMHPYGALPGKEGEEKTPALYVFRLKSGHVIRASDHLPVEPTDGVPGLIAAEGDGRRDDRYRAELQEACNAYRRAAYAVEKQKRR